MDSEWTRRAMNSPEKFEAKTIAVDALMALHGPKETTLEEPDDGVNLSVNKSTVITVLVGCKAKEISIQSKPLSWWGGTGVDTAETTTPATPTFAIATWCWADHCSTTMMITVVIVIVIVSITTIIATKDGRMGCTIVIVVIH